MSSSSATVFVALVITVFAQKSVAVTDNSAQCNTLVGNIIARMNYSPALKSQPDYVIDMQKVVAATLDYQLQSSMNEIGSVAAANVPNLNSIDARNAVQAINDKGIMAIWATRVQKVDEFRDTYGSQVYGIAQATARNPNMGSILPIGFSQQVSKFCTETLGIMDGLKTKIVADIQSFVKRTNGSFPTPPNDVCASMVSEMFQKLSESKDWDSSAQDVAGIFYLRQIASASYSSKSFIENAYDGILKSLKSIGSNVDNELVRTIAVATTKSYSELDMNTFKYHFMPRLQQLVQANGGLQSNAATLIGNDIANLCRVALDDYQQIQEQTIKQMEAALPANIQWVDSFKGFKYEMSVSLGSGIPLAMVIYPSGMRISAG